MSKPIVMTQEIKSQVLESLDKSLGKRMINGTFSFSRTIADNQTAIVTFTEKAWIKQAMLIQEENKEVAWHGVCHREGDNEFVIEDILVYPQSVTAASVDMDVEQYSKWLMDNDEDERFNRIRFQAHSHVNMGVQPSGTDTDHQEQILNQLGKDDYYVFMIMNKKGETWQRIYDLKYNRMYEKNEIEILIDYEEDGVLEWLDESKKLVKDFKPVVPPVVQTTIASAPVTPQTNKSRAGGKQKQADLSKRQKERIDDPWYRGMYDDEFGCSYGTGYSFLY